MFLWEFSYPEIIEKLEKISRNNKAWSKRKSDTRRNTFAVQSTHNPATDQICEEMAQIRTDVGLVLKHIIGGEDKINPVNYLSKPPPPNDECYYAEDSYTVNNKTGGFRLSAQAHIKIISSKVKGTKFGSIVTITIRVIMFEL